MMLQFKCHDNRTCVPLSYKCDGDQDCDDNSDENPEFGCPLPQCDSSEILCANGRCIRSSFFCDGFDDCLDSSDEPYHCGEFRNHHFLFDH